jgi:hypothetical protein
LIDKLAVNMLRDMKPPYPGIVIDITENPSYIGLRVYENQIMALSDEKQYGIMMHLHEMRKVLMNFGYKVFFEGSKGDPPRTA